MDNYKSKGMIKNQPKNQITNPFKESQERQSKNKQDDLKNETKSRLLMNTVSSSLSFKEVVKSKANLGLKDSSTTNLLSNAALLDIKKSDKENKDTCIESKNKYEKSSVRPSEIDYKNDNDKNRDKESSLIEKLEQKENKDKERVSKLIEQKQIILQTKADYSNITSTNKNSILEKFKKNVIVRAKVTEEPKENKDSKDLQEKLSLGVTTGTISAVNFGIKKISVQEVSRKILNNQNVNPNITTNNTSISNNAKVVNSTDNVNYDYYDTPDNLTDRSYLSTVSEDKFENAKSGINKLSNTNNTANNNNVKKIEFVKEKSYITLRTKQVLGKPLDTVSKEETEIKVLQDNTNNNTNNDTNNNNTKNFKVNNTVTASNIINPSIISKLGKGGKVQFYDQSKLGFKYRESKPYSTDPANISNNNNNNNNNISSKVEFTDKASTLREFKDKQERENSLIKRIRLIRLIQKFIKMRITKKRTSALLIQKVFRGFFYRKKLKKATCLYLIYQNKSIKIEKLLRTKRLSNLEHCFSLLRLIEKKTEKDDEVINRADNTASKDNENKEKNVVSVILVQELSQQVEINSEIKEEEVKIPPVLEISEINEFEIKQEAQKPTIIEAPELVQESSQVEIRINPVQTVYSVSRDTNPQVFVKDFKSRLTMSKLIDIQFKIKAFLMKLREKRVRNYKKSALLTINKVNYNSSNKVNNNESNNIAVSKLKSMSLDDLHYYTKNYYLTNNEENRIPIKQCSVLSTNTNNTNKTNTNNINNRVSTTDTDITAFTKHNNFSTVITKTTAKTPLLNTLKHKIINIQSNYKFIKSQKQEKQEEEAKQAEILLQNQLKENQRLAEEAEEARKQNTPRRIPFVLSKYYFTKTIIPDTKNTLNHIQKQVKVRSSLKKESVNAIPDTTTANNANTKAFYESKELQMDNHDIMIEQAPEEEIISPPQIEIQCFMVKQSKAVINFQRLIMIQRRFKSLINNMRRRKAEIESKTRNKTFAGRGIIYYKTAVYVPCFNRVLRLQEEVKKRIKNKLADNASAVTVPKLRSVVYSKQTILNSSNNTAVTVPKLRGAVYSKLTYFSSSDSRKQVIKSARVRGFLVSKEVVLAQKVVKKEYIEENTNTSVVENVKDTNGNINELDNNDEEVVNNVSLKPVFCSKLTLLKHSNTNNNTNNAAENSNSNNITNVILTINNISNFIINEQPDKINDDENNTEVTMTNTNVNPEPIIPEDLSKKARLDNQVLRSHYVRVSNNPQNLVKTAQKANLKLSKLVHLQDLVRKKLKLIKLRRDNAEKMIRQKVVIPFSIDTNNVNNANNDNGLRLSTYRSNISTKSFNNSNNKTSSSPIILYSVPTTESGEVKITTKTLIYSTSKAFYFTKSSNSRLSFYWKLNLIKNSLARVLAQKRLTVQLKEEQERENEREQERLREIELEKEREQERQNAIEREREQEREREIAIANERKNFFIESTENTITGSNNNIKVTNIDSKFNINITDGNNNNNETHITTKNKSLEVGMKMRKNKLINSIYLQKSIKADLNPTVERMQINIVEYMLTKPDVARNLNKRGSLKYIITSSNAIEELKKLEINNNNTSNNNTTNNKNDNAIISTSEITIEGLIEKKVEPEVVVVELPKPEVIRSKLNNFSINSTVFTKYSTNNTKNYSRVGDIIISSSSLSLMQKSIKQFLTNKRIVSIVDQKANEKAVGIANEIVTSIEKEKLRNVVVNTIHNDINEEYLFSPVVVVKIVDKKIISNLKSCVFTKRTTALVADSFTTPVTSVQREFRSKNKTKARLMATKPETVNEISLIRKEKIISINKVNAGISNIHNKDVKIRLTPLKVMKLQRLAKAFLLKLRNKPLPRSKVQFNYFKYIANKDSAANCFTKRSASTLEFLRTLSVIQIGVRSYLSALMKRRLLVLQKKRNFNIVSNENVDIAGIEKPIVDNTNTFTSTTELIKIQEMKEVKEVELLIEVDIVKPVNVITTEELLIPNIPAIVIESKSAATSTKQLIEVDKIDNNNNNNTNNNTNNVGADNNNVKEVKIRKLPVKNNLKFYMTKSEKQDFAKANNFLVFKVRKWLRTLPSKTREPTLYTEDYTYTTNNTIVTVTNPNVNNTNITQPNTSKREAYVLNNTSNIEIIGIERPEKSEYRDNHDNHDNKDNQKEEYNDENDNKNNISNGNDNDNGLDQVNLNENFETDNNLIDGKSKLLERDYSPINFNSIDTGEIIKYGFDRVVKKPRNEINYYASKKQLAEVANDQVKTVLKGIRSFYVKYVKRSRKGAKSQGSKGKDELSNNGSYKSFLVEKEKEKDKSKEKELKDNSANNIKPLLRPVSSKHSIVQSSMSKVIKSNNMKVENSKAGLIQNFLKDVLVRKNQRLSSVIIPKVVPQVKLRAEKITKESNLLLKKQEIRTKKVIKNEKVVVSTNSSNVKSNLITSSNNIFFKKSYNRKIPESINLINRLYKQNCELKVIKNINSVVNNKALKAVFFTKSTSLLSDIIKSTSSNTDKVDKVELELVNSDKLEINGIAPVIEEKIIKNNRIKSEKITKEVHLLNKLIKKIEIENIPAANSIDTQIRTKEQELEQVKPVVSLLTEKSKPRKILSTLTDAYYTKKYTCIPVSSAFIIQKGLKQMVDRNREDTSYITDYGTRSFSQIHSVTPYIYQEFRKIEKIPSFCVFKSTRLNKKYYVVSVIQKLFSLKKAEKLNNEKVKGNEILAEKLRNYNGLYSKEVYRNTNTLVNSIKKPVVGSVFDELKEMQLNNFCKDYLRKMFFRGFICYLQEDLFYAHRFITYKVFGKTLMKVLKNRKRIAFEKIYDLSQVVAQKRREEKMLLKLENIFKTQSAELLSKLYTKNSNHPKGEVNNDTQDKNVDGVCLKTTNTYAVTTSNGVMVDEDNVKVSDSTKFDKLYYAEKFNGDEDMKEVLELIDSMSCHNVDINTNLESK